MSGEIDLAIVVDLPPTTGIGTYAWQLYRLLKPAIPLVRLVYLRYRPGESYPECIEVGGRRAESLLTVPFVRAANSVRVISDQSLRRGNLHLVGTTYFPTLVNDMTVCTVHDFYYRKWSPFKRTDTREWLTTLYINARNSYLPLELRRARAVVADSRRVAGMIEEKTRIHATAIPIWTDPTRFSERSRAEARHLLHLAPATTLLLNVSGGGSNKNLITLERISDGLPPSCRIIKIGYPLQSDRALNVGTVSDRVYPLYFNACDAYLHVSIEEGFGKPLLEALASGLPIVSPPWSTAPEILAGAARFVRNGFDEREYLDAIRELVDSSRARQELRERSLLRAAEFHPTKILPLFLEVYRGSFGLDIPHLGHETK